MKENLNCFYVDIIIWICVDTDCIDISLQSYYLLFIKKKGSNKFVFLTLALSKRFVSFLPTKYVLMG